jgi:ankyrin repeat protein
MNKKRYISDNKILTKGINIFQNLEIMTIEKLANLLENNPQYLNLQDPNSGSTLLFKAVQLENYEAIEFLLKKKANLDIQNIYGETPLHLAVENGNIEIVNILLEKGSNPNIQQQVIIFYISHKIFIFYIIKLTNIILIINYFRMEKLQCI